jgi:hypothetical protein
MLEPHLFYPPRRRGLVFHAVGISLLGLLSAGCFLLGLRQEAGGYFALWMLLSLFFFVPLVLVVYRAYALLRARYLIEREGLRLRWGLRVEDIPVTRVEWIRPVSDLPYRLRLPFLAWPGAILGSVHVEDLGEVEFLAADESTLLLVATPQRVYAISPADPKAFLRVFHRMMELGSLEPLIHRSVQPTAFFRLIWEDRLARWLILLGAGLVLLLFTGVSLIIPTRAEVSLGFSSNGTPLPGVPAAQLLLLPVLSAFALGIDLLGGLFFYRQPEDRVLAFFLWFSGVLMPLLMLVALALIL